MTDQKNIIEIPYKFKCRPYQIDAWKAIDRGVKRLVCAWHRGCGKDLLFLNKIIEQMLKRPGVYLHCFPGYSQGKRSIWKSVHTTHMGDPMSYLDHFPPEIVKSKNGSDMSIELHNGAIYYVMGLDGNNATAARGMNPYFVILSEYAFMDAESWYTLEPRITQNNGTAIFLSTPNGQNHFYHLYNYAKEHPELYYSSLLTIDDTKAVDPAHIDQLRNEGVPEDFILQEYYCSFTRGAEGSYYGKLIQKARDEGRIENLPILSHLPVHTAWDIGYNDSNVIWFSQQLENGKINVVNYYENSGESLEHYLRYLDRWKIDNSVIYGRHFGPHDMANKSFQTGLESVEVARKLGYSFTVVPKLSIPDGIQAVRSIIPQCSFDRERCKRGLKALDFYRKKYNDSLKTYYDEPLHDQWSHGADAFRYFAVGYKTQGLGVNILTPDKIREMRQNALR